MRYRYGRGVFKKTKATNRFLLVVPLVAVLLAGYLFVNLSAPKISLFGNVKGAVANKVTTVQPSEKENRLLLPQLNVDVPIVASDDPSALEGGAWHRSTNTSSPVNGGNYAISAYAFKLELSPLSTKEASPFHNLEGLSVDDEIFVDYSGVRYAYKVTDVYSVVRSIEEIERTGKTDKMTLYTHTDDSSNKRVVVEAKPIGTVSWDGAPRIEYFDSW